MIDRKYDRSQPYAYVMYGRMSTDLQNERSPDQQFNTIKETIQRHGHPWREVARYRDNGKSGRLVAKRPGLQEMLRAVETGQVVVDLIVVDTLERLGRAEEIPEVRRSLFTNYGVLVVAADNNFADPTGAVGKALGMIEQMRSTENTRISGHNVKRGKKDAARLGHWPGGPTPFGFKLKRIFDGGDPSADFHSVLEPDPRESAALILAFERAAETGHGSLRMCKWWNENPEIPDDFKPTNLHTMLYRLRNKIAIGVLVWGVNRTDVVNDARVIERNPDGPEETAGFCPPLISVELFERVQVLFQARSDDFQAKRRADPEAPSQAKLIRPQTPGLALKYPLSGIVRCGACGAAMRPVPSGSPNNVKKSYLYYSCPRHFVGACENDHHVRGDKLRAAVFDRLRARLFPPPERKGKTPEWFPEMMLAVEEELKRRRADEPDRAAAAEQEVKSLERQLSGWMQTLGDPNLDAMLRNDIQENYKNANNRRHELQQALAGDKALEKHAERVLDSRKVVEQLHKLDEVLAGSNASLCNIELSRHVEGVDCFPDGRVLMRGTYLGLFEGAVALLSRDDHAPPKAPAVTSRGFDAVVPRRLTRRRAANLSADSKEVGGGLPQALDPERFAGLHDGFMWKEPLVIEKKLSWAEANAAEVVRMRTQGLTVEELTQYFDMTPPTIRSALKKGLEAQSDMQLPRKMPRGRWHEDHADEVMKLKKEGLGTNQLVERFGKSDTTIRAALKHAEEKAAGRSLAKAADESGPLPGPALKA